jgi:hypothetical protein
MGNGSAYRVVQHLFLRAKARGVLMNPASLRDLAQRCRELMRAAQTNVAKEQLRVWAEEFEEQAAISAGETAAMAIEEQPLMG